MQCPQRNRQLSDLKRFICKIRVKPENSVIDADGAGKRRITQIFFGCPPLVEPHLVDEGKESAGIKSALICVISVQTRFLG